MKIIYKAPGEAPEVRDVPNTLATLQALVGGNIEVAMFAENAALVSNEEMLINTSPHNTIVLGRWYFGPVFFVGIDGEDFCDFPCDEEFGKEMLRDE